MKILAILWMLSLCITIRIFAQEAPKVKFEKVPAEELTMKTYANDTTADAVILYDDGTSYVRYEVGKGFMLTYERFVRIKILKQNGVEWGNFKISLYSTPTGLEEMSRIKGTTINWENGKIVKVDLKKTDIFKERENKYWEAVRFSMPSVKVGSVIDLQYTISTNMKWNLRTWKFQYTIPVRWSQYKVVYPEYFTYNQLSMGYHSLLYNRKSQSNENISYTEKIENTSSAGFTNGPSQTVVRNISYMNHTFEYAAKDIPALKKEQYLTSLDNFTTQIKFELANTNFTTIGGKYNDYTTSWNDIAKQLEDGDNFGRQLSFSGFLTDDVAALTKGTTNDMVKLNLIFNHVQNSMKWDGFKSIFTDKSIKKAYAEKTGNSADINLLLVAMLQKAGINASPVILSTRENGILSIAHATISDCNYVIASVLIDGKQILLDATEPDLQVGYIPFRCLNGEGHLINKKMSESVQLVNPKSVESTVVELELKEGRMEGTIKQRETGLSAFDFRESVKTAGGKKEMYNKIKNNSPELDYLDYKYSNLDSLDEAVLIEYKFALKEKQETGADIIYLDPVVLERQKDNPFAAQTRTYPVDFGVPFVQYYNLQFTVPQGYSVEELPKNITYLMEEKGGQFQYQVSQLGSKVVINMVFSINKATFLPSEYTSLKHFFDLVINKQSEQIVLKKKTT
jgi:hypothetical protein